MYGLFFKKSDVKNYALIMNSTLTALFLELFGRTSLGEGALGLMVYEYLDIPIVFSEYIIFQNDEIINEILFRPLHLYRAWI